MDSKVAIIILNWNGWKDTVECLESLYRIIYPNYDVIVIDNGSKDNSVQKIKEYCEGKIKVNSKFFEYNPNNKPIYVLEYTREQAEKGGDFRKEKYFSKLPPNRKLRLILNEKNYGFAGGCNIGIRYALKALNPDYILLLNNDTVVDRNFLTELVKIAENNNKIGIVGPKQYYYSFPDRIAYTCGRIDLWTGNFNLGLPYRKELENKRSIDKEVEWLSGACMLVKKQVIETIGLLDEGYFAYWEDTDWCYRVRKANYKIIHSANSKFWHKITSTSGGILSAYYDGRNRFLFMKKHANLPQLIFFLIFFFIIHFWIISAVTLLYDKNFKRLLSFYRGTAEGLALLFRKNISNWS